MRELNNTDAMKWFDRKFAFDLATWMYPNVVERIRGTPARLEDMTRGLEKNILTLRHGDAWSIQEHAGHLLDLEPLWLGRVDDFTTGEQRLRDADLTNAKTHRANHNVDDLSNILAVFRDTREKMIRRLDELDGAAASLTAIHPRLEQPMRLLDLIFFVAEHDDHHLAKISELKKN